jgi:predicted aconitase
MQTKMKLSPEDEAILKGEKGETLQKVMKSVVLYGETFGATELVPIQGLPHLVTSFGANTITPYFDMLDELINAGLKTQKPFTVDPRPMEYDALKPGFIQRMVFGLVFGKQKDYEGQLRKLGLKDERAFTCTCYMPEVGNVPETGDMLAWSESSAVVYANSVLGARTNRNSAGIDVMCDILGKAPYFGLMTDEGRKATWKIELKTKNLPNAQLLGSAIGIKVMEDVPYICGLDKFLGEGLNPSTEAYLKDMGAATASNGAVGLYHAENITPEACEHGESLLAENYQTYVIDEEELLKVMRNYPMLWKDENAAPKHVFIGCPHLSRQQILDWGEKFKQALKKAGQEKVRIQTHLFTAPDVALVFKQEYAELYTLLENQDIHLTSICPLMYMNNPLCGKQPIVTNSNKLRTYTTARFFLDDEICDIAVSGQLPAATFKGGVQ